MAGYLVEALAHLGCHLRRRLCDAASAGSIVRLVTCIGERINVGAARRSRRRLVICAMKFYAVLLCGGNKEGGSSRKFYKTLIDTADKRFDEWLEAKE